MVKPFLAALALIAAPLHAQWPDHGWWTQGRFIDIHPVAHSLGGGAMDIIARGPWIAKSWRDAAWKRLAWAGVIDVGWEYAQIHEFHGGYPTKYAIGDILATLAGAAATDAVLSWVKQHL